MTSLYDILKEVAPKRALFTSYTYSSVWFEAEPYPLLHKNDCEQMTVVLDAREARHSVDNSSSRFGGSRYRVVSTTPTREGKRGGIFHPKIAYLESDAGDVLVVGSANLTVQGQSRSLEVLDTVSATLHPTVFGQIADFFESLPARLNLLTAEDKALLAGFAQRARAQRDLYSAKAMGPQKVWLVTTLTESAGAQFAYLAQQNLATPKSLTVLSPYFDEDVGAVVRLRDKLRVEQVRYGLARRNGELIAPFLKSISEGNKPRYFVEPPDNGRPLHAKWFELVDVNREALVMTGSVNATHQSLWNTNNIEVALVRHVSRPTTANWKSAGDTPRYEPCEYPAPLATDDAVIVVAHITRSYLLEVVCCPVPGQQKVQLDLRCGIRHLPSFTATLDAQGRASVQVGENLVRDLPDRALWLTVHGATFEVTTWVNVEPQLSAKPKQVDLSKSIGRVEKDDYDDDDAYLLLNAAHLLLTQRKLNNNGRTQRKRVEATGDETDEPLVSEAGWLAGQRDGAKSHEQPSVEAIRIFKTLGKLLNMSDDDVEKAFSPNADESGDMEPDDDESDTAADDKRELDGSSGEDGDEGVSRDERRIEKKRKKRRESVAHARDAVQLAIDERLRRPMPDGLAMLAVPQKIRNNLRAGMPAALHRVDTGHEVPSGPLSANASSYLMGLLSTLMALRLGEKAVDYLLPMVASAGAMTALCYERRRLPLDYAQIRSALEIFAGRQLSEDEYVRLLEAESRDEWLPLMHRFKFDDLLEQTRHIARAPRVEDRIDRVLALALEGPTSPVPDDKREIKYLVDALRNSPGNRKLYSVLVVEEMPVQVQCPQCYATLEEREFKKLKSVRMAVCQDTCKRPIFMKLGPAASCTLLREQEACVRKISAQTTIEGDVK